MIYRKQLLRYIVSNYTDVALMSVPKSRVQLLHLACFEVLFPERQGTGKSYGAQSPPMGKP